MRFITGFTAAGLMLAITATGQAFEFSFSTDETIDGTPRDQTDILDYTGGISLSIAGDPLFSTTGENVDAFHRFGDGSFLFSTTAGATVADGGVGGIDSGDIIRYDPSQAAGSRASVFFDDFGPNVNGISVDANGLIYITFSEESTYDSTTFNRREVLTIDTTAAPGSQVTSLFDSATLFPLESSTTVNPDALHILGSTLYFSMSSDVEVIDDDGNGFPVDYDGGYIFQVDLNNIAGFDPVNDVYFASGSFGTSSTGGVNVDALHIVPEPASLALLGLGGLAMLRRRGA